MKTLELKKAIKNARNEYDIIENLSEDVISELAKLSCQPWIDNNEIDTDLESFTIDECYYDPLDFENDVLIPALTQLNLDFDYEFDENIISKIAGESENEYKNAIISYLEDNLPRFFSLEENHDGNGNCVYTYDFNLPDDGEDGAIYVAVEDNGKMTGDFDYVKRLLIYDDEQDVFIIAIRSYMPHPTMGCGYLGWSIEDFISNFQNHEWDEIFDEELLNDFNERNFDRSN